MITNCARSHFLAKTVGFVARVHSGVAANKPTRHYRGLKALISANESVATAPFLGAEVV